VVEDELPPDQGERRATRLPEREAPGEDLSRILSLTDGVFAFALTLLVLGLTVPMGVSNGQLAGRLGQDWQTFLGYAFAFVMIAVWWTNHHRTFRYIERYDSVLMWLNMAVLLEIAVMPFILQVFADYPDAQVAVVLFAFVQMMAGFTLNLIWRYAAGRHRLVDPRLDEKEIHFFANWGLIPPIIFAVSIGVTFLNVGAAEVLWLVSIVARRWGQRYGPS
jgi:uncharacterized membrane protein